MRNAKFFSKSYLVVFLIFLLSFTCLGYDGDNILDNVQPEGGGTLDILRIKNVKTLDMVEDVVPATPSANNLRLFVEDFKGFSFFSFIDDTGMVRKIVRDSVFVGKNDTLSSIAVGKLVYANGSSGNVPTIALAKADSATTMPCIGITVEAIASGAFGRIMQVGLLENFDTNAFTEGNIVYVSESTAGGMTVTPPVYPNLRQEMGTVLVKGVGTGAMQVIARPTFNDSTIIHDGLSGAGTVDTETEIESVVDLPDLQGVLGVTKVPSLLNLLNLTDPNADKTILWDDSESVWAWTDLGAGSMVYPGAGIAVSTGSAWGTSLSSSWLDQDVSQDASPVFAKVYINETSNVDLTYGLTINQGTNDDDVISLKSSSDVTHPFTASAETDTYGNFRKAFGDAGGLLIRAFTDTDSSAGALRFIGAVGTTDPTDTYPVFKFEAYKSNGTTGAAALGNAERVLQIGNSSTAIFYINGNGDTWVAADMSALTFTDRTPFYEGDALDELSKIKGINGQIDHTTLPVFAKKEDRRDLGAMISMLTVAVQQLNDEKVKMTDDIQKLEKRVKDLEDILNKQTAVLSIYLQADTLGAIK